MSDLPGRIATRHFNLALDHLGDVVEDWFEGTPEEQARAALLLAEARAAIDDALRALGKP